MATASEVTPKLSPKLSNHVQGIDLDVLSRIPTTRFVEKSIPNIGLIELVSGEDFSTVYDGLYVSMFPNRFERERSDLINDRLRKEFANQREGLAPYRVIGIRDHDGKGICAAHFSVLLLPDGKFVVPYLQYIYVRPQNRRQDMADLLHTLILAVSTADAANHGRKTVPFTLFETEPAGHGDDDASRAVATQRVMIHAKAGAVALMLRKDIDRSLLSPHVQPGLKVGEPPLSLIWAVRRSPAMILTEQSSEIQDIGLSLIAAYYKSMRDEGFPEANICLAESVFEKRHQGCEFVLVPLQKVVLPRNVDIEQLQPRPNGEA